MTLLPAVCFTCGAEAYKIIRLSDGCAALPNAQGYLGICPQHDITIEPIGQYKTIATIPGNEDLR